MEQVAREQAQAPATPHTNNDGASKDSSEDENMARLLDMVTELKDDIRARVTRLKARKFEDDQSSVVSAGNSTFRANAETRVRLGRNMTIPRLKTS